MLLTEFDHDRDAVINPDIVHKPVENFPETVISIFSHRLFQRIVDALNGRKIAETKDVDGVWPVYEVEYAGHRFALYKARLGAPACVGCFEDIIPMGARRIILLGNCGVLDGSIEDCGIVSYMIRRICSGSHHTGNFYFSHILITLIFLK